MKHPVRSRPAARWCALALGGLTVVAPCRADEGPLTTDRPDFSESTEVVGPGRFQIETSVVSERDTSGGTTVRTRTTPTLFRLGLDERWEARLETDGFARSHTSTGTAADASGFADIELGVKWHQQSGDEATGAPGMAWLLHVGLATGTQAFRGPGTRPSLRYVVEWDLPQGWSLGLMPGVFSDRNAAGQRYAGGIFAATLGKSLSSRWQAFAELAGQQLAARSNGGNVVSFDTGVAWLANDDLQFDLSLYRGLNANTPEVQWDVGLSARF
jgi:hypothetical protein